MTEKMDFVGALPPAETTSETTPPATIKRQVTLWRLVIVGVLLAFVAFLAIGLNRQNSSEWRATGIAPDFEFTTFDGETIRLADLKGKGVVLNFWASWCGPCRDEAALLEAAWRREKNNNIVFLGLDYLDQEHSAKAYLAEFGVSYPNGPDLQSKAARRYGISGVPETFFIGPDGLIKSYLLLPLTSEQQLDQHIDGIRPQ
jgi:cytochrome c biogenesis protein CcmG, thiol:disulfide interchange protein DsbE